MRDKIKVASCSIYDLFNGMAENAVVKGKLTVPDYQRAYVWGEEQLKKLIFDLEAHYSVQEGIEVTLPMYYLGSIILHEEEVEGQKTKLNIIDGQQRITTLAIIQQLLEPEQTLDIAFANPTTVQNIKTNYDYLKAQKERLKAVGDLTKINVTVVITTSEDDAYTFFETQNTGGIPLGGVDLIKAYHLRAFEHEKDRSEYALLWEQQKEVKKNVRHLLKARRWNVLSFLEVPKRKDLMGQRKAIQQEYSESTVEEAVAYQTIRFLLGNNATTMVLPQYQFSIRQPLAKGKYFIEYLAMFCNIYERLFINSNDSSIDAEFYKFRDEIIRYYDGTFYLIGLYEIALLCYVQKFGYQNLLEAAYWLFRYCYAPRVINNKTVRESSISAFICKTWLFDVILNAYEHRLLMQELEAYDYDISNDNCQNRSIKVRFVQQVGKYFDFNAWTGEEGNRSITSYDNKLKKSITQKLSNDSSI